MIYAHASAKTIGIHGNLTTNGFALMGKGSQTMMTIDYLICMFIGIAIGVLLGMLIILVGDAVRDAKHKIKD